jgi:hypothetical protein
VVWFECVALATGKAKVDIVVVGSRWSFCCELSSLLVLRLGKFRAERIEGTETDSPV